MSHLVILAVLVLAPIVLLTVLRVDAVFVFLSLCLGEVLVKFAGSDAIQFINAFSPHASSLSTSTIQIILMLIPVVFTLIAMFHTVSGAKVVMNLLPALCTGVLLLLLVEPLLSPGIRGSIENSRLWQHVVPAQTLLVGTSAIIILIFLWLHRRGLHKGGHKSHSRG